MGPVLTIPRKLTHGDELIIVRRYEYEQLQKRLIEIKDVLMKIRHGEREFREGKTRVVSSLAQLH